MASIEPAVQFYADDVWEPFRDQAEQGLRASVYCVAAVPALAKHEVLAALPRRDGELLKAKDRAMSPHAAAAAISKLLQVDGLALGVLLVDANSENNRALAAQTMHAANAVRAAKHEKSLSEETVFWGLCNSHAVGLAWRAALAVHPGLSYVDLVFDETSAAQHTLFSRVVQETAEPFEITYRNVRWESEQAEPLLHLPDLVAGVYHRYAAHDDVEAAVKLVESAKASGRIVVQHGFKARIPDAERVEELVREAKNAR